MMEKVCSVCGQKLSAFYKTGYLGCENCYKEFESEITATLKNIQGGSFHVGKKPEFYGIDRELISDYNLYLKEKEKAIIEKRFLDVAKLNKLITEISEELKRRGLM